MIRYPGYGMGHVNISYHEYCHTFSHRIAVLFLENQTCATLRMSGSWTVLVPNREALLWWWISLQMCPRCNISFFSFFHCLSSSCQSILCYPLPFCRRRPIPFWAWWHDSRPVHQRRRRGQCFLALLLTKHERSRSASLFRCVQVNLSVGAYRTEEGKPWILPSVAEAEKMVRGHSDIGCTKRDEIES